MTVAVVLRLAFSPHVKKVTTARGETFKLSVKKRSMEHPEGAVCLVVEYSRKKLFKPQAEEDANELLPLLIGEAKAAGVHCIQINGTGVENVKKGFIAYGTTFESRFIEYRDGSWRPEPGSFTRSKNDPPNQLKQVHHEPMGNDRVLLFDDSPDGRYRVHQDWFHIANRSSWIIVENQFSKPIAQIKEGTLGPILWTTDGEFLILWVQDVLRPTSFSNTSYNQYDAVELQSGNVADLIKQPENEFRHYFEPMAKTIGGKLDFRDYIQSYFLGYVPEKNAALIKVGTLGYDCNYYVRLSDGSILERNVLGVPAATLAHRSDGKLEAIRRGDLITEGGIAESREVFSSEGKRLWIDLYYQVKFGQAPQLKTRIYTEDSRLRVVPASGEPR